MDSTVNPRIPQIEKKSKIVPGGQVNNHTLDNAKGGLILFKYSGGARTSIGDLKSYLTFILSYA